MNKKTLKIKDLFRGEKTWILKSTDGLTAPLGWDEKGKKVFFTLSNNTPHALMGGPTGSGKSNLLHVILCSLCNRYSPEELQVHLLDMKDGVEAFRYVDKDTGRAWLPHVKSILAADSPILAKQILSHVEFEIASRGEIFKKERVASFAEWRAKTGSAMPRILVIIDEFTLMFEDDDLKRELSDCLYRLMVFGRACGVHVLLASQVPDNLPTSKADMAIGQAPLRLALPGAKGVLTPHNLSAQLLIMPQCILNDTFGNDGHDFVFTHPLFINHREAPTNLDIFRKNMAKAAKAANIPALSDCEVYDSDLESIPVDGLDLSDSGFEALCDV